MEKFEEIMSITFKSFLSKEKLQLKASKRWNSGISDFRNTYIPKNGDKCYFYKKNIKIHVDTGEALAFLKDKKMELPNAIGLIPLISLLNGISKDLKRHFFVLGLDEHQNLKYKKGFGHVIPYAFFNSGEVTYGWFSQNTVLEEDEWFLGIERK